MSNKKKIGIVTITNDGYNFGNRLQNYALQSVLERMGFHVETLNRPIREDQRSMLYTAKIFARFFIPYHRTIGRIKAWNFFFWNRRYIKWSNKVATDESLPTLANQYDFLVAGSDQIWNPEFSWGKDPYMFLQFARPEQRVAYAPSIGLETIENQERLMYKERWSHWRALSSRETKGAEIIADVTGENVPTLIDPTLLLTQDDWRKMTHGIRTPRKYIFVYMLGDIICEYKEYLDKIAKETDCELVDVMYDKRFAGCNPSEFVALIQHAERVVADSYHAMVFAMLFHRPFTFIDRVGCGMNMNSRVQTLIDKFGIPVEHLNAITEFDINSDEYEKRLQLEREKAMTYLKKALV